MRKKKDRLQRGTSPGGEIERVCVAVCSHTNSSREGKGLARHASVERATKSSNLGQQVMEGKVQLKSGKERERERV